MKIKDALGRAWQCSTIQVDFNLPERFDVTYVAEDGSRQRPVMIHRALLGSMERFFGAMVEHYAGDFPAWLAPVQATVLTITSDQEQFAFAVRDRSCSSRAASKSSRRQPATWMVMATTTPPSTRSARMPRQRPESWPPS